ncbi:MAG TPA: hypothetical protein PLK07_00910, partial [Rectinema sp.]|nr:hypothetical protein [Rectinema sp.]
VGIGCFMHCFSFRNTGLLMAAYASAGFSLPCFSFGKTKNNQNSSLISPLKTLEANMCLQDFATDSP